MDNNTQHIKAGKIIGAHGIRGGLRVFSYLESPANFGKYKKYFIDGEPIELELNFVKDKVAVIDITGVRKRELAEAYIGKEIYMHRDELPKLAEGESYYSELIGLKLRHNNAEIGVLANISNFGAGEVAELELTNNTKKLVIFNRTNFPEINKEQGYITIIFPEEEFDN